MGKTLGLVMKYDIENKYLKANYTSAEHKAQKRQEGTTIDTFIIFRTIVEKLNKGCLDTQCDQSFILLNNIKRNYTTLEQVWREQLPNLVEYRHCCLLFKLDTGLGRISLNMEKFCNKE